MQQLLLPLSLKTNSDIQAVLNANTNIAVSYYPDWDFNAELSFKKLTNQFKTANLKAFGLEAESPELVPAGFLLDYLEKTTNTVENNEEKTNKSTTIIITKMKIIKVLKLL